MILATSSITLFMLTKLKDGSCRLNVHAWKLEDTSNFAFPVAIRP
jgi:hypothetical protein